jgi:hypothetical protein
MEVLIVTAGLFLAVAIRGRSDAGGEVPFRSR